MVRAMRITVDYSEEAPHDGLVRNTPLQNCFSILNHLCWSGEYQPRNFRSKMAMFYLHLRNIVILITIASNGNIQMKDKTSPLDEPGMTPPPVLPHAGDTFPHTAGACLD